MPIPIENIYYLLCYAWNKLDEKDRVAVSAKDFTELLDLLAKVLINSTRILLKRGIDNSYIDRTTEFLGVKGKLELSQSVKSQLLFQQKTICSFDEFSSNTLTNRILVTTLSRLLKTEHVDATLKYDIKNLLWRFVDVDPIELDSRVFDQIKFHRNNKFYEFIMIVCRLVYENTLPSEKPDKYQFADFIRDERKMNQLFEAFLRNFYAIEQTTFKVRRENINWQFSANHQQQLEYLPRMQTDITLENDTAKIIIEAKFYKETLKTNYGAEKISSANLYQLFSYLINQRNNKSKTQTATGILLYPSIGTDYDFEFKHQNHRVFIKTVNLNSDWRTIYTRLIEIISV